MKQKILTFIVCLLAGITAIHAQTESESSIVSFIKTADDWKVLESMSVSDNKVVYTLKDGSQLTADVTHGQEAELPVYNAIYCVPGHWYPSIGRIQPVWSANPDGNSQSK